MLFFVDLAYATVLGSIPIFIIYLVVMSKKDKANNNKASRLAEKNDTRMFEEIFNISPFDKDGKDAIKARVRSVLNLMSLVVLKDPEHYANTKVIRDRAVTLADKFCMLDDRFYKIEKPKHGIKQRRQNLLKLYRNTPRKKIA